MSLAYLKHWWKYIWHVYIKGMPRQQYIDTYTMVFKDIWEAIYHLEKTHPKYQEIRYVFFREHPEFHENTGEGWDRCPPVDLLIALCKETPDYGDLMLTTAESIALERQQQERADLDERLAIRRKFFENNASR